MTDKKLEPCGQDWCDQSTCLFLQGDGWMDEYGDHHLYQPGEPWPITHSAIKSGWDFNDNRGDLDLTVKEFTDRYGKVTMHGREVTMREYIENIQAIDRFKSEHGRYPEMEAYGTFFQLKQGREIDLDPSEIRAI